MFFIFVEAIICLLLYNLHNCTLHSIRNKFGSVRAALVNYVDIIIAAETKINKSVPEAKINKSVPNVQFAIDGFDKPLRLDVTDKCRGLLDYISLY